MTNTPMEIRIKPLKDRQGGIRVRITQVDAGGRYSLTARQMTLDEALSEVLAMYGERADRLGLGDTLTPPIGGDGPTPNSGVD